MTTKQYLSQIERLNKTIENKIMETGQIRWMAYNISAPIEKDRVQTSHSYDKLGDRIAKLVDIESEISDLIDNLIEKRKHIIGQIDKLEKKEHYLILTYKYVQFLDFKDIFLKMGISERTMYSFYGQALKEFERLYGSEYLKL